MLGSGYTYHVDLMVVGNLALAQTVVVGIVVGDVSVLIVVVVLVDAYDSRLRRLRGNNAMWE